MSQFLFKNLNPEYILWRQNIKYKTQVGLCISEGFRKRGYTRPEKDENWDIYWVEKQNLDNFYANHRVTRQQRINHFRTYFQICRKDNLNRNLKKYKRALQREGRTKQANQYNFIPLTFHLPIQFASFCEQFKRMSSINKSNIWIMKPTAKSQGKGIFLFNKLSAVQEWMENSESEAYICQKYIENPLLIGHKKFDLRLYVLCTSYRPLTAYIYRQGFARFTHSRYDDSNIAANYIHLTNVAIQKHTSQYSHTLGGKWMLSHLKKYLLSKYSHQAVNNSFYQIKNLVIKTLRSVSKIMSNETNCFQLYGLDVMLDDTLKPWLIQVNGSPSMRANTKKDRQLKVGVIDDMLSVIDIQGILAGNQQTLGGFDAICRKDVNFQFQYFAGLKSCMLGCKLQREKCYRTLASNLNTYYKNGKNLSKPSIQQQQVYRQTQAENTPSQLKKGFSVRKQQKPTSTMFKQQIRKDSQKYESTDPISISRGKFNPQQLAKSGNFNSSTAANININNIKLNVNSNPHSNINNMNNMMNMQSIEKRTTFRRNSNLMRTKKVPQQQIVLKFPNFSMQPQEIIQKNSITYNKY